MSVAVSRPPTPTGSLTRREWDVAQLLAQGLPAKTIAACLGLSVHTVRRHSESIFRKLGVQSRTVAALRIRDLMDGAAPPWGYLPSEDATAWYEPRALAHSR